MYFLPVFSVGAFSVGTFAVGTLYAPVRYLAPNNPIVQQHCLLDTRLRLFYTGNMRVLLTIPHFFDPAGQGQYASQQPNPAPRVAALTQSLRNLCTLYASPQEYWYRDGERLHPQPANQEQLIELDIVICTCRDFHLLEEITLAADTYSHEPTDCEPLYLGFECQRVLQERLGTYDLYGYMEDDLILHDPDFFTKLRWFQGQTDGDAVLQPNRFERYATTTQFKKVYIDFEFRPPDALAALQTETVDLQPYGQHVTLARTSNPHSGTFFLTESQMRHLTQQDYFVNRETSYVGPLESAASLGLYRSFKVYKPAPSSATFLEIEHYGQAWSHRLAAVRFPPGQRQ